MIKNPYTGKMISASGKTALNLFKQHLQGHLKLNREALKTIKLYQKGGVQDQKVQSQDPDKKLPELPQDLYMKIINESIGSYQDFINKRDPGYYKIYDIKKEENKMKKENRYLKNIRAVNKQCRDLINVKKGKNWMEELKLDQPFNITTIEEFKKKFEEVHKFFDEFYLLKYNSKLRSVAMFTVFSKIKTKNNHETLNENNLSGEDLGFLKNPNLTEEDKRKRLVKRFSEDKVLELQNVWVLNFLSKSFDFNETRDFFEKAWKYAPNYFNGLSLIGFLYYSYLHNGFDTYLLYGNYEFLSQLIKILEDVPLYCKIMHKTC